MKSVENYSKKWVHAKYTDAVWYHFKAGQIQKVPEDLKLDGAVLRVVKEKAEEIVETKKEIKERKKSLKSR